MAGREGPRLRAAGLFLIYMFGGGVVVVVVLLLLLCETDYVVYGTKNLGKGRE